MADPATRPDGPAAAGAKGAAGAERAACGHRLEVEGLQVRADGASLLDIATLRVAPGACVGVRGVSGAGKSTLLLALAGLAPGAVGAVRWDGRDLLSMRAGAQAAFRRAHIALVFQEALLFDELGPAVNAGVMALCAPAREREAMRRRAADALRRLGAPQDRRSVARCSGGERQRIAVARALAGAPAVIMADEPTASLDHANAARLGDDLTTVARRDGRTLIVASHDDAMLARMDRVITLSRGRIVADSAGVEAPRDA